MTAPTEHKTNRPGAERYRSSWKSNIYGERTCGDEVASSPCIQRGFVPAESREIVCANSPQSKQVVHPAASLYYLFRRVF